MSLATHQHYVPQFLLRYFGTGKRHHVHVFEKRTGRLWKAPADRVAAERGFYNVPESVKQRFVDHLRQEGEHDVAAAASSGTLSLEQSLGRVESLAANVISRIVREESVAGLSPSARSTQALFAVVQQSRSPATRDALHQASAALRSKSTDLLRAHGRAADESLLNHGGLQWSGDEAANAHLQVVQDAVSHLPLVESKDLLLHRAPPGHRFLIGDSPVTLWNHGPRGRSLRRGFGLATPGPELSLPLTPHLVITFACPSLADTAMAYLRHGEAARDGRPDLDGCSVRQLRDFVRQVEDGGVVDVHPDNVTHFNARQVVHATRYLYGHSDTQFALAREMIADDDRLRLGPQFVD
jgi:hypothetical protein